MTPGNGLPRQVVHVIDDDEAVRRAIAMLLRSAHLPVVTHPSGLDCLGAVTSAGAGAALVLTDLRMPGLDGLELLRRLQEGGFRGPVIVMTAHGDVSTAVRAMKAGAADFIEKPFDDEALLTMIWALLDPAAPSGTARGADEACARIAALTPREREVLRLLSLGKSNKAIARDLDLSPRTVEVHRARLMTRLEVGSLAEAVRLAVRAELGSRGPEEDAEG